MKFSKLSQLFLVSALGLMLATFLTACQLVTLDFLFVAASEGNSPGSQGQISTYAVDSETGALRTGWMGGFIGRHCPGFDGSDLGLCQPLCGQRGQ